MLGIVSSTKAPKHIKTGDARFTVRLPLPLDKSLEYHCIDRSTTKQAVVVAAVDTYLKSAKAARA